MVERGLRLLVKTNRAATAGRFTLGRAPVDLKLTPLMPSIDRPAGTMMAAAPAWHVAETETHPNSWDACHALLDQGLGVAGGDVVFAEPDLEQTWLWTTPNRQALAIAGCDAAPPNHDVYATGNTNLWFVDEAHTQLEETRARVAAPDPTTSPRNVVRIAHLDTGYDDNHATRPRFLNTGLARNFVDDDRPNDATDKPTAAINPMLGHGTGTLSILAGKDLDKLMQAAARRDFKPVPLGIHEKLTIHNSLQNIDSHNVIAKVTGGDPELKNTYVIYTAHWDHFGIGPEVNGDKIYHGAVDNASGSAALLEIARAYKQLRRPPSRTILFISVTGEEQGLLGSQYYAEHPIYPLARTSANINMDGMNVHGLTRDIVQIGRGVSTLDEIIEAVAKEQGRVVKSDPEPEKGYYYRSDHFEFAKKGVPAFDPNEGVDFIGKPDGWGLEVRRKYTAENYHKPSDTIKPDWELSGAVQDCQLFFLVGYRIANDPQMPEWKPGAEFKAIRDASLRSAASAP